MLGKALSARACSSMLTRKSQSVGNSSACTFFIYDCLDRKTQVNGFVARVEVADLHKLFRNNRFERAGYFGSIGPKHTKNAITTIPPQSRSTRNTVHYSWRCVHQEPAPRSSRHFQIYACIIQTGFVILLIISPLLFRKQIALLIVNMLRLYDRRRTSSCRCTTPVYSFTSPFLWPSTIPSMPPAVVR